MEVFETKEKVKETIVTDNRFFEIDEVLPNFAESQHFLKLAPFGFFRLSLELLEFFFGAPLNRNSLFSLIILVFLHSEKKVRRHLFNQPVQTPPDVPPSISELYFLNQPRPTSFSVLTHSSYISL